VRPLGLPRGSVRAILALGLVGDVIALSLVGLVDAKDVVALAGIALAFYFAGRGADGSST